MTQKYKYDLLVFIGRFQPFHLGHKAVIDRALELSKNVLILLGSANRSPSLKNPWNFLERKVLVIGSFQQEIHPRIIIKPLNDHIYADNLWTKEVREIVENVKKSNGIYSNRIGLIGHSKDHSSYYLKLFPDWGSEEVENVDGINSTDIRNDLIEIGIHSVKNRVPEFVYKCLLTDYVTHRLDWLLELRRFIHSYKENVTKYPRIEHTVDAVVVQSGHVLLIERKHNPGIGLLALPGGFIHPDETLQDAMIRELREETKLKVPTPVLTGSIKKSMVFDDPGRSERGRIITQAFLIELERQTELPKVKGSDDAKKAMWIPLNEINPKMMFEDHYFIIERMVE